MLSSAKKSTKKGSALIAGMTIVLVISGLVIASHMLLESQSRNIEDFADHQSAAYLSRAGVNSVYYWIKRKDPSRIPMTQDQSVSYTGTSHGNTYYVTVTRKSATASEINTPAEEDMVAIYEILSSGIDTKAAQTYSAVVDVTMTEGEYVGLEGAIITEGDLTIIGSPSLQSSLITAADAHTNGNGLFQNGCILEGNFETVGSLTFQGSTYEIGGATLTSSDVPAYQAAHSGVDPVTIPTVDAADYQDTADYQLISSGPHAGKIYVKATGNYVSDSSLDWNYKVTGGTARWESVNRGSPPEGLYYIEGDLHLNHAMGSSSDPFNISIACTGSVDVNGRTSKLAPHENGEDLLILADGDIKFTGQGGCSAEGLFFANEQIYFSGSSSVIGMIIAADRTNNDSLVTGNTFTGSTQFTAGDDLNVPNATGTPILSDNLKQYRKASYEEQTTNFLNFGLNADGTYGDNGEFPTDYDYQAYLDGEYAEQ